MGWRFYYNLLEKQSGTQLILHHLNGFSRSESFCTESHKGKQKKEMFKPKSLGDDANVLLVLLKTLPITNW